MYKNQVLKVSSATPVTPELLQVLMLSVCETQRIFMIHSCLFMPIRVAPQALIHPSTEPNPLETDDKNSRWKKLKRQFVETKPMELLNKTYEIVEQNQWNCSTISMEWLAETASFRPSKWG
jgi:hypothetical protein